MRTCNAFGNTPEHTLDGIASAFVLIHVKQTDETAHDRSIILVLNACIARQLGKHVQVNPDVQMLLINGDGTEGVHGKLNARYIAYDAAGKQSKPPRSYHGSG